MPAAVVAVCISERKGERKKPVPTVELRPEHGIVVRDVHAVSHVRGVERRLRMERAHARIEDADDHAECAREEVGVVDAT